MADEAVESVTAPSEAELLAGKYWTRRHLLWSKYEEGIRMDREGWFSVTPEALALHAAAVCIALQRGCGMSETVGVASSELRDGSAAVTACKVPKRSLKAEAAEARSPVQAGAGQEDLLVLDAFAGSGGNAIAFARQATVSRVIAVDVSAERLADAAHNAAIYGVADKITFVVGNAVDMLRALANPEVVPLSSGGADTETELRGGFMTQQQALQSLAAGRSRGVDIIFVAPPWGGVDYKRAKRPKASEGASAQTPVFDLKQRITLHEEACMSREEVGAGEEDGGEDGTFDVALAGKKRRAGSSSRFNCRCEGGVPVDGVDLLQLAVAAAAAGRPGEPAGCETSAGGSVVAAFLPCTCGLGQVSRSFGLPSVRSIGLEMQWLKAAGLRGGAEAAAAVPAEDVPADADANGDTAGATDAAVPPPSSSSSSSNSTPAGPGPDYKPTGLLAYAVVRTPSP